MVRRILIAGIGGQGIAFAGQLLGEALSIKGLYSCVHNSYGAEVRGGIVMSSIIYDTRPILNPFTDRHDIYLILHDHAWRSVRVDVGRLYIADKDLAYGEAPRDLSIDFKPFHGVAYTRGLPINLVALGYLARIGVIEVEWLEEAIKRRGRNIDLNLKAVRYFQSTY